MADAKKEETRADSDDNSEEILALMVEGAGDPTPDPGDVQPGFIASRGDNPDAPFPSVVSSVESAGYITVYNRLTGDTSIVSANPPYLAALLKKRYPENDSNAGKIVFTLHDPGFRPAQGQYKCYLHKGDSRREQWDILGLPVCEAGNLASAYHRDRHLNKKHGDEAGVIADIDRRKREDEDREDRKADRELQREILTKLVEKKEKD